MHLLSCRGYLTLRYDLYRWNYAGLYDIVMRDSVTALSASAVVSVCLSDAKSKDVVISTTRLRYQLATLVSHEFCPLQLFANLWQELSMQIGNWQIIANLHVSVSSIQEVGTTVHYKCKGLGYINPAILYIPHQNLYLGSDPAFRRIKWGWRPWLVPLPL